MVELKNRHCLQQLPSDSIQVPTIMSLSGLSTESNLPITLSQGIRSTFNPSPHYISISYYRLSLPFYTFLSYICSITIPKFVSNTLAHLCWCWVMLDELSSLENNGTWSSSHYRLGNLLLVVSGFLLSKLVLMLIALKPILWAKVTHRYFGWIIVIFFLQWQMWLLFVYL